MLMLSQYITWRTRAPLAGTPCRDACPGRLGAGPQTGYHAPYQPPSSHLHTTHTVRYKTNLAEWRRVHNTTSIPSAHDQQFVKCSLLQCTISWWRELKRVLCWSIYIINLCLTSLTLLGHGGCLHTVIVQHHYHLSLDHLLGSLIKVKHNSFKFDLIYTNSSIRTTQFFRIHWKDNMPKRITPSKMGTPKIFSPFL